MNDLSQSILQIELNIAWLPMPNQVAIIQTDQFPPLHLVTSALALVFDADRLLMTKLTTRGWDIPGGHVEVGEMPEATMRREVYEETGVTLGAVTLFALQHFRLLGSVPTGYRYPFPDSYQAVFLGRAVAQEPFQPTAEASERAFFSPEEARGQWWVQENQALYEAALHQVKSDKVS